MRPASTVSAGEIDCLIVGFLRRPALHRSEGERLKVLYAMPVNDRGEAGEVITDDLTVACGESALRLLRVQRAGKGVMEARELLKGFPLPPGTKLG
jgi:methionyl-tRNA formyltransferase